FSRRKLRAPCPPRPAWTRICARSWNTGSYSGAETVTKRRSPLARYSTLPSRVAKIVSSRPMPVPTPGRKRVPRWRTRIIPAVTSCPANFFAPRYLGLESRPFRDEPMPFLCAMSLFCLFLRGRRLLRRSLLRRTLGLGLLGRRLLLGGGLLADRLDLDLREPAAEAGVLLVPGLRLVLADPDLLAEHVADYAGRDGDALRPELR